MFRSFGVRAAVWSPPDRRPYRVPIVTVPAHAMARILRGSRRVRCMCSAKAEAFCNHVVRFALCSPSRVVALRHAHGNAVVPVAYFAIATSSTVLCVHGVVFKRELSETDMRLRSYTYSTFIFNFIRGCFYLLDVLEFSILN